MKRNFFSLLALFTLIFSGIVNNTMAQEFKSGDNVLSLGLGIGSSLGHSGYSSQMPGFSLSYEHGQWDVDGPGNISLGGYIGFKSFKYENIYYTEKLNYTIIGIRSAYHFNMIKVDHLDVYGGLMLSYNIASYSFSGSDIYTGSEDDNSMSLSLYCGARYYLSSNMAAFMELGYGVSILNIGGSYKF
jgi:hypothetical protein